MPYWRDSWRGVVTKTVRLASLRKTDGNYASILPNTAGAGYFALRAGNHATVTPNLRSEAAVAGAKTSQARFEFPLPPEYVTGGEITLRIRGMTSVIASVSSTLDVGVIKPDKEGGVDGSDLYAGSAVDFNSTSWADYDFALTVPATLAAGDMLDIEITTIHNNADGNSYTYIGAIELLLLERF